MTAAANYRPMPVQVDVAPVCAAISEKFLSPVILWDTANNRPIVAYYRNQSDQTRDRLTYGRVAATLQAVGVDQRVAKSYAESLTASYAAATRFDSATIHSFSGDEKALRIAYAARVRKGGDSSMISCMCYPEKSNTLIMRERKTGRVIVPSDTYAHKSITLWVMLDSTGRVIARAVGSTKKQAYTAGYAVDLDSYRVFTSRLADAGVFQRNDAMRGVYLRRIVNDNCGTIAPYIDGNYNCLDDDHRVVSSSDSGAVLECSNTDGTASECGGTVCDCCGCRVCDYEAYYSEDAGATLCDVCYGDHHAPVYGESRYTELMLIRGWDNYTNLRAEIVYEYDGEYYTADGLAYHDLVLLDGEVYPMDEVLFSDDGEACQLDDGEQCPCCGSLRHPDDMDSITLTNDDAFIRLCRDCQRGHITKAAHAGQVCDEVLSAYNNDDMIADYADMIAEVRDNMDSALLDAISETAIVDDAILYQYGLLLARDIMAHGQMIAKLTHSLPIAA